MNSETVADVVKSLRDRAEGRRKSGKLLQIDDKMFDLLADRIEAAHRAEIERGAEAAQICGEIGEMIGMEKASVVKQDLTTGNAAKMRKALKESADFAREHIHYDPRPDEECYCLGCCEARAMVEMCESALSAPPRNCDTLKSYDEFVDAWNAYVRRTHGGVEGFLAWLSAEAKGEAK